MATKVVSVFDANNGFCSRDLFTAAGFEVIIKSDEALAVANKVISEWGEGQLDKATNLVYDSDVRGCSDYSHDIMDAIRSALEAEFGRPGTTNSPIESLGYDEARNSHWAVWSREVEADQDGNIIRWLED